MKNNKNMKQLIEKYDTKSIRCLSSMAYAIDKNQYQLRQTYPLLIPTTPHRFSKEYAPFMLSAYAKKHARQSAHTSDSV